LAAVRQRASTMRLGIGVVPAPIDHPLHIVQRMATLDIPSHGRVDVGLGREALDTLRHFGEHVIPHWRDKEPRAAVA
jgi:alkanesulfonate monooxygenase SsuD/methylene tetrahydromethanopterin reductase-like flavin-dependent oxidoreductase (luciferase family)